MQVYLLDGSLSCGGDRGVDSGNPHIQPEPEVKRNIETTQPACVIGSAAVNWHGKHLGNSRIKF